MAKISNSIQKQFIDENGAVRETEISNTINWGSEPNYVKLYLDDILYLSDLPKGLNSILYALLKRMAYGNQLVLNAALKRQIAREVNLGTSSVNNAITKFVKGQLLKRIDTGIYLVNPQLFGKGEWKDISKIRLTAKYDLKGRTIMAEIEKYTPAGIEAQKQEFLEKHDMEPFENEHINDELDSELSPGEKEFVDSHQ